MVKMKGKDIFTTVHLDNGLECVVSTMSGRDVLTISLKTIKEGAEYIQPIIMSQLCVVNGEKKGLNYYLDDISGADFISLSEAIAPLLVQLEAY